MSEKIEIKEEMWDKIHSQVAFLFYNIKVDNYSMNILSHKIIILLSWGKIIHNTVEPENSDTQRET